MPSVAYMNQSAPFWDFVASLEQQGQNHPFFSQNQNDSAERGEETHSGHPHHPPPSFGPWGWGGFGGRGFPFRGPPPPPGPPHEEPAGENHDENESEKDKEKEKDNENGEGPSGSDHEGCTRRTGRHGRCGGRRFDKDREGASGSDNERGWGRHGRCGGRRGGPHGYGHHGRHGPGPHHGPGHHGPRRGGWGPWARGGPFGGGPFNPLNFAAGLLDPTSNDETKNESQDFTPEADIFDTESAFVVHVSLPGAKKEDVGVNWDAEKSELSIAGVIYRPGDEDFLKTLAMDERKVGPFERKVRLGTRAIPAQIDAEMITAKLDDGILRVNVPKLETGFVEVRKVDIE